MKHQPTEKGKMEINGCQMNWEMIRSKTPSIFGIDQSRIYELNLYRDGTLTADYNRKWIRVPDTEDEASSLCLQYLVGRYGKEKEKKEKKDHD